MVGSHLPPVALAAREGLTVAADAGSIDSESTASHVADADRCPCLSGDAFGDCCAPLLRGAAVAVTAERLMRSRYSAFAVGDAVYLLATWHPSTRPGELELDADVQWRRLDILNTVRGDVADDTGEVEFRAYWRVLRRPGRARDGGVLHERSSFRRENGRWFYVDGTMLG
ncbi:YchJ family protein [Humibacter sp. RRB41]|uniref:YchJ family protein n=1 Tax=Humibacter sp. RRB41 TaxID=2919946 RepID=UPI0027E363F2|nr:YchJ family protein [Humibacter sp. RRB41]